MSMILMIHTVDSCKEYVLPGLYNSDFSIVLPKDTFGFSKDITLYMETVENIWSFSNHSNYMVLRKNQPYFEQQLQNGDILELLLEQGESAAIIVCEREEGPKSFQKYDVSGVSQITIGKNTENMIVYDFYGLVSREHGLLYRKGEDWFIRDCSANGIFFQWKRIKEEQKITFGERVYIFGLELLLLGDVLCIGGIEPVEVAEYLQPFYWKREEAIPVLKKEEKTRVYYHRSPRILPVLQKGTIILEFPTAEETAKLEDVPLLKLGNVRIQWKRKKKLKKTKQDELVLHTYLEKQLLFIKEKYQENQRILRENYPSATVCCDYDRNTSTLWNRNFSHKDILFLRLGLGQRPFELNIEVPERAISLHDREQARLIQEKYRNLTDVPVGIDLLEHRLCGVIGGMGKQGAYQVAQIMLAQICANVCYTDVKIAIFYHENSEMERKRWEFARWLPHIWNQEKTMRFLATNREEAREVSYELARIFRKRAEGKAEKRPHFILCFAEPEWLEGELLEKYVYENQPEYGVSTCLLVENYEDLPNCCGQVIQNDANVLGMYHVTDGLEKQKEICFDKVSIEKLEQFSKCLAGLKVKEAHRPQKIPKKLTFLEMYDVKRVEELPVKKWWRKQRSYDSMHVCIGKRDGDRRCFLDIHENYHGPHGLIAGTTGAGKSELLLTFLLSLAINFSPKDVSFLLIDYKGGGMAQHLEGLPHLAGNISNLCEHGVRRAMVSLQSEIKRRQRLFLKYGINHIHTYTKKEKSGKIKEELPHLCIVVDEFAELKKEEPDFLQELISVAQVGRSLGIHLILATQKPGGTVDENIWSNSRFRICLRVQDEKDSCEVLKKADAAFLTQPGQGYLQVGNDEVYERFQTGWSGAAYGEDKRQAKARLLTGTGKEVWIASRNNISEEENRQEQTQLLAVVEYLKKIARESKVGESRKLWLPVLPEILLLEQVEAVHRREQEEKEKDKRQMCVVEPQVETMKIKEMQMNKLQKGTTQMKETQADKLQKGATQIKEVEVDKRQKRTTQMKEIQVDKQPVEIVQQKNKQLITIAGLCDDPEEQRQIPFLVDFTKDGHCCVIGSPSSGKSSVLQSMVWSLLKNYSANELHLYLLDFGGGMLSVFKSAPQVGGVILEQDAEMLETFFYLLQKSIKERKELLQGVNYVQYIQNAEHNLPAIVVVLDNMASFRQATEDTYTDLLYSLLRKGTACGIYFVLAANGFGVYDIPGRMQDFLKTRIALGLPDKYKYMEVLNVPQITFLPPKQKKGSGLVLVEERPLELQIALAGGEDVYERGELLKEWCHKQSLKWKGKPAKKIPEIPKDFQLQQFAGQSDYKENMQQGNGLPVGLHRMEGEILLVKPEHNPCFLIAGTKGSGRKNVAKVLMYGAKKADANVTVFGTSKQELKDFAEKQNVVYMEESRKWYEYLEQLVEVETNLLEEDKKDGFGERQQQQLMQEATNQLLSQADKEKTKMMSEVYAHDEIDSEKRSAHIIIIEDIHNFMKQIYEEQSSENPIVSYLENILEQTSQNNIYWIVICNTDDVRRCMAYPAFVNMARKKAGLYLGGKLSEQSLFTYENISFEEGQREHKVGTGYAFGVDEKNSSVPIVIPRVKDEE